MIQEIVFCYFLDPMKGYLFNVVISSLRKFSLMCFTIFKQKKQV